MNEIIEFETKERVIYGVRMRIEDNIVIFQFKSNKVSSIQLETLKALDQVIDRVNNEEELKVLFW